jgi:hypothetical protein
MPANQANVEYWFRLAYECLHGSCYGGSVDASLFIAWLAHLWLWIILVGYLLALIALISIVYTIVRLFELRKQEAEFYGKIIPLPGAEREGAHPRWDHIQSLTDSLNPNDWRSAIIEADILLEETLTQKGYKGAGLGEKLKAVAPGKLATLSDAWEAHKVRNQIAHEGSTFNIPDSLAKRTIAHYEAVFKELRVI